jgi:hypothetical protein
VNPDRFSEAPKAQIKYQNGQSGNKNHCKNTKLCTVHSISFQVKMEVYRPLNDQEVASLGGDIKPF